MNHFRTHKQNFRLLFSLVAFYTFFSSLPVFSQVPVDIPELTDPVMDTAGLLDSESRSELEKKILLLEKEKGSQLVVYTLPGTGMESIEEFGIRLADTWKVGRKGVDDGVILIVAAGDRKVRIEVGYGLEGAIPDIYTKRIIREAIVPSFRKGDFAGGILLASDRIIGLIRGEDLPPAASQETEDSGFLSGAGIFWILFVGGMIIRSLFGRVAGAFAGAILGFGVFFVFSGLFSALATGFMLLLLISLSGTMGRSRGMLGTGSHYGGFGGGMGGGSFGGGGFSGGGGSFGGGGASGSW